MNKRILWVTLTLLIVVMTATQLIEAAQAGYGGKNTATFEWYVVQWPLGRENRSEDTRSKLIEKKDGTMVISHDVFTYGEPPVVLVTIVQTPRGPLVTNPTWDDYPAGGIRLNITEGTNTYTLIGTFEKTMQYIAYNPKAGILENSKWSFTITAVEDGDAPSGAVGSTMYGTIKSWQGGNPMAIKSTKGTGIFEGAFLRGTHTTFPGFVLKNATDPMTQWTLLSTSVGSGEIVFP